MVISILTKVCLWNYGLTRSILGFYNNWTFKIKQNIGTIIPIKNKWVNNIHLP